MSDSSSITMHRKYVDPWDLDLREVSWRHSSDTTDCSADHQVVSLSSAAGPVSTRSDFVYVPGPPKSNKSSTGRTRSRSVARYDCCRCSPSSSSMALVPPDSNENLYEYWETGCKPPSYCKYSSVDHHFYPIVCGSSKQQCRLLYNVSRPEVRRNSRYDNGDMESVLCRAYMANSGEYNSTENMVTSQFRYNTLGHMKIDYSSNWNNLDKYICQV
ncbi:uncharacterized protein LOC112598002 [Melanaphis sacchari]|uniref:uncharacterized protein LOC112598002 n=1 Tax=Melanaphis sacchari TaxID=742174 RepID=UPI000DC13F3E|nr:uncharacterized protein LOC112598002 [Melanaphis sacchari]